VWSRLVAERAPPVKAAPGTRRKKVSSATESTRARGSRRSVLADFLCTSGPADGRSGRGHPAPHRSRRRRKGARRGGQDGGRKPTSSPPAGSGAPPSKAASGTRRKRARLATLQLRGSEVPKKTAPPSQMRIPNEKSRCSEWSEVRSLQAIVLRVVVLAANRRSRRARPQKAYRCQTGRDRGPDRGSGEHRRKRTATSAIVATICGSGPPQGSRNGGRCHRIAGGEARFTRAFQEAVFDRRFDSAQSVRRAGQSVTGHPRSRAVIAVRRKCRPGNARAHRSERIVVETSRSPWSSCGAARQRTPTREEPRRRVGVRSVWLAEVGRTCSRCSRESVGHLIRRASVPTP
jgi:hypothetical protein